jgi:spore germination protein (amino acid permease)
MREKVKIGSYKTTCLLMNMILYKMILLYPRNAAEEAGNAGWIMTIVTSVYVFILFLIQKKLYDKFSGQDILDIGEHAFGKTGKILTGLLFIANFLILVPIILREFSEDIKVISLTTTPVSVIIFMFCIGMVIGAYIGIEAIARIHALAVPFLAITFILILLLCVPKFDINNLSPWLGLGPLEILKSSVFNLSNFSEFIVLYLITPFLKKKKEFNAIGRYSIIVCAFFMVIGTISYMLVFQYPISIEFFLPIYQLARSIRFGRFFTRIEPAFILIWASSAFLFLSSGLYFIVYLFQRSFGLKYYKPLILPFTVIIFALSMVPENLYSTLQLQMITYRNFGWILTFLLPILLFGIASIRNKSIKNKETIRQ